jgi:L-lactate dehydrogenase complex protein LldF
MVYAKYPFVVNNGLNPWFKNREMPEPPKESLENGI